MMRKPRGSMNKRDNNMTSLIAGTAIALTLALAACSGGTVDASAAREHCLYAAISAYPTWPHPDQAVVDTIEECRDLPRDDKTQVRQMTADFVNAAITRAIPE